MRRPLMKMRGRRLDAERACPRATSAAMRSMRRGIVEAGAERRDVEADVARVAEQAVAVERLLILEQQVVVLPEASELARALRGGRRQAGVGVELRAACCALHGCRAGSGGRRAARPAATRTSSRRSPKAWPQAGHSKSENSTIVTGASARPFTCGAGPTTPSAVDDRRACVYSSQNFGSRGLAPRRRSSAAGGVADRRERCPPATATSRPAAAVA